MSWFAEKACLDAIWGAGGWTLHKDCPASDQPFVFHSRVFHERRRP